MTKKGYCFLSKMTGVSLPYFSYRLTQYGRYLNATINFSGDEGSASSVTSFSDSLKDSEEQYNKLLQLQKLITKCIEDYENLMTRQEKAIKKTYDGLKRTGYTVAESQRLCEC